MYRQCIFVEGLLIAEHSSTTENREERRREEERRGEERRREEETNERENRVEREERGGTPAEKTRTWMSTEKHTCVYYEARLIDPHHYEHNHPLMYWNPQTLTYIAHVVMVEW
jgi:hypothetical protein